MIVNNLDNKTIEFLDKHEHHSNIQIVLEDTVKPDLAYYMNLGHKETKWPDAITGYFGDDFIALTKSWDLLVEHDMEVTNNCCLISGPDGYLGNSGCPTFFFIHPKLISAMGMGEFVCHLFPKEGTDKAMGDILLPLHLIIWDETLFFDHQHSTRDVSRKDETFDRLQTASTPEYGRAYWNYIKTAQQNIIKNLAP
jgi:hypothetical protein